MTMTNKKADLLWIDLEMTGLDPIEDRIMEVAVIATDWDFNEIADYQAVIEVEPNRVESRMKIGKDFWDANPESRDELIKQNIEQGRAVQEIEDEIIKFIAQNFDNEKPVLLAGNSIHQDRKFIAREWPDLDKKLHYRMLDVSAWKVVFNGKYKKMFAKQGTHRALDDIRGSIMEMKYYLGKVKV